MAFTNLWRLISGGASYGKNFEQFLDGGAGGYLTAAYTDLASLATVCGGSYTNLLALMSTLTSNGNNIQEALNHTSQSQRTLASSELVTLLADFNTFLTTEGVATGDFSGLSTAWTKMMTGPNSTGAWSERLTTAQITAALTAATLVSTKADSAPSLVLAQNSPDLWLDSDVGVTYEGTGTGTGTAKGVSAWTSRDSNAYVFAQTDEDLQPYYHLSDLNTHAALQFVLGNPSRLDLANTPLTGTYGYFAAVTSEVVASSDHMWYYSQANAADNVNFFNAGTWSNSFAQLGTTGKTPMQHASAQTGAVLHEFIKANDSNVPVHRRNGVVVAAGQGNVVGWAGSVTCDRSSIGSMAGLSRLKPFSGKLHSIWAKDSLTNATTIAAIRAALIAMYGIS
jgi:hypothetical protein